jgi:O-antigen ligase
MQRPIQTQPETTPPPEEAPPAPPGQGLAIKVAIGIALLGLGKVAAMVRRGPVGTPEMRLVGIVIGEVALLFSSIWNVFLVFFVLLFYLPFNNQLPGDFGTAVNITNILIFIVIFGLFFRSIREGAHFFVRTTLDGWIALYLMLIFVSFLRSSLEWGRDWFMLVTLVKRFCTPIIMFYVASWVIRDREGIKNCIFVIMITTLMVAFLSTKDTCTPTHFSWQRREAGVISQANIMAAFMIYYMFYFYSFFKVNSDKPKYWLLLPCLYPCARSLMLTFSRGGYMAFVVAVLFVSFMTKKAFFIVTIFVMAFIFMKPEPFLPGSVIERWKGTVVHERDYYGDGEEELEGSAQSRLVIWRGGLKMIARHPILGIGYGQFPVHIGSYVPRYAGMDAHNAYILIAAEMGLPALFIFLWITYRLFRFSLEIYKGSPDRLYSGLGFGYATGVVGFWVANLFGSRFNTTETIAYFWVLAALVLLIKRMHPTVTNLDVRGVPLRNQGNQNLPGTR